MYSSAKSVPEESDINLIQDKQTLMDVIIDTVSKCSDEYDDGVHLQVIKALLTAVTSPYCEVHEASLILAVRACFHVHLITKNQVNKTTAKAALTQVLSVVFRRMEVSEARSRAETTEVFSMPNTTPETEFAESARSERFGFFVFFLSLNI